VLVQESEAAFERGLVVEAIAQRSPVGDATQIAE
jgi:hypothetical protein